ncbi:MAG: hypothetical protein HFJ40_06030 [Clostridia bacterium]|nr:hypothetical protein [Clostridia bacterium]
MNIPKYVSAEEYSRQSGMGVEEVKRQCRIGEIPCKMTEKGYYKIPIYEDSIPIEQYQNLNEKYLKLLSKFETIQKILN